MKLSAMKDEAFAQSLQRAARRERMAIADVVEHLAEADRREWHLRKGFPGLMNYCVARLKYSQEAAGKRVTAARLVRKYPLALAMLREGDLHLSGLLVLSPVLQPENVDERLKAAAGKTREQIELLVAGWRPKPVVSTRVFEVKHDHRQAQLETMIHARAQETATEGISQRGPATRPAPELPRAPRPRPIDASHYKLKEVCIDRETYDDLRWLQDHLRHSIPDGDAAKVIAKAIKELRKAVEKRRYGKTDKPKKPAAPAQLTMQPDQTPTPTPTPAIEPRAPGRMTRREVSERDGCQCTYVGDDGHRCEATGWLEFDHIEPWAEGGSTTAGNLRTLCRAHHRARNRHPPRGGSMYAITDRVHDDVPKPETP